jgi:hypothetical protein
MTKQRVLRSSLSFGRGARSWRLLTIGLSLLIVGLMTVSECAAQVLVDVSAQVTVKKSGLVFNRTTNTFDSLVTITNSSATVLNGPLVLVISNLAPTTVTLVNPSGEDPSGNPFVNLTVPTGGLSPGTISSVLLKFNNPNRVAFSFMTMVAFRPGGSVTPDGSSIVFKTPAGTTVLTIPLLNQEVVTSTPQGNITTVTHERANISDDASHAGVYTVAFDVSPSDSDAEALMTGTFRYYDASGQLWQITAPLGTAFYLPINTRNHLFTPDASRVLMISADVGNTNPAFSVYDQAGDVLYQSAGAFVEFQQAQISPNGRYLLVMGIVRSNNANQDLIRVTDLNTNLSSDLPFDIATAGVPAISISGDGRFLISYQGNQTVLPIE